MQYSLVQYITIEYNTLQYNTVQYITHLDLYMFQSMSRDCRHTHPVCDLEYQFVQCTWPCIICYVFTVNVDMNFRMNIVSSSMWIRFPPPPAAPHFFCSHLQMPIESEIIDGFWCSRCLNDCIDLPNMIGSFESGATASLVAKNGTKKFSLLSSTKYDR